MICFTNNVNGKILKRIRWHRSIEYSTVDNVCLTFKKTEFEILFENETSNAPIEVVDRITFNSNKWNGEFILYIFFLNKESPFVVIVERERIIYTPFLSLAPNF